MSWEEQKKKFEDQRKKYGEIYYPKREVSNKNSKGLTHIIGSYYSPKMDEQISFESLNELDVYILLEMSSVVWGYYPQPEKVHVQVYGKMGELKTFPHYPDVLVCAEESKPCLYQIKGDYTDSENTPQNIRLKQATMDYARENGWNYKVIHTHNLSEDFRWNVKFIFPFLKKERANTEYSDAIFAYLNKHPIATIDELANLAVKNVAREYVLPVIYHEIANGLLYIDLSRRIDGKSKIRLAQEDDVDYYQYIWELE